MSSTLPTIFLALEQACLAEGGDGDALCLTPDYKAAAGAFEAWLKSNGNTWWTRSDREDYVTFSNDQECIYFASASPERFRASYTVNLAFGLGLY